MEGACPGHGWRRRRAIRIWAAAVVAVLLAAGAAVLVLHTRPGKIPVHVLPVGQDMDSATAIAVDGPDVWVANETDRWGGSVTELNARGGYHFTSPGLVAAVGAHIWVFGRDGVRVLTDPAPRPGRGERQ
jgi:hypothetical protein